MIITVENVKNLLTKKGVSERTKSELLDEGWLGSATWDECYKQFLKMNKSELTEHANYLRTERRKI